MSLSPSVRERIKDPVELQVLVKDVVPDKPVAKASSGPEVSLLKYSLILLIAIGMKSWQPIAVGMSKREDGTYSYNKTFMVLLVELAKLIFCTGAFLTHYASTPSLERPLLYNLPFKQSLHFVVPSILYAIANTMVYVGISFINPALFHVFGNIRILTAGILYRIFMHKPQSDLQWLALILLTAGAVLATPSENIQLKPGENNTMGLLCSVLMCMTSSASSIYTEINYKKTQQLSIFYQNMVLYVYGIIVNGAWIVYSSYDDIVQNGLFHGFDLAAVHVLVSQAAMGISLSFIFKYLDNITYVIAFTISMFISAILSIVLFEFEFTLQFMCALLIVSVAIYHYYREKILEKYKIDTKDALF